MKALIDAALKIHLAVKQPLIFRGKYERSMQQEVVNAVKRVVCLRVRKFGSDCNEKLIRQRTQQISVSFTHSGVRNLAEKVRDSSRF